MSASKFSIVNEALLMCGENVVAAEDNGTKEWNVCSAAYEAGVEHLLDEHDWKFGTAIEVDNDRLGDSPDPAYEDKYAKPNGCLHVIWVKDEGGTSLDWRLVGNNILVTKDDGITVKFVTEPDPSEWPGLFLKSLRHFVMAGIYRGLKHDARSAQAEEKSAEFYLAKARPRGDSEEPSQARFVSGLATARSRRRV